MVGFLAMAGGRHRRRRPKTVRSLTGSVSRIFFANSSCLERFLKMVPSLAYDPGPCVGGDDPVAAYHQRVNLEFLQSRAEGEGHGPYANRRIGYPVEVRARLAPVPVEQRKEPQRA
jgi:hypothetical protein